MIQIQVCLHTSLALLQSLTHVVMSSRNKSHSHQKVTYFYVNAHHDTSNYILKTPITRNMTIHSKLGARKQLLTVEHASASAAAVLSVISVPAGQGAQDVDPGGA